ncbi:MAG: hypothetical protein P1V51_02575 [Deltaproteobacteria bacterium]|nr:hypothetical protein [Deltaproteobacteria bacterium]
MRRLKITLGGLLAAALLVPGSPARAAPVAIGVMDFVSKGGLPQERVEALADLAADAIRGQGDYQVITTQDIRSALQLEEQKQLLGCFDESCMAQIGGALGVRWIVTGNLSAFGEAFLLNVKLFDSEELRVVASASRTVEGGEARLLAVIPEAIEEILGAARPALHPPRETPPVAEAGATAGEAEPAAPPPGVAEPAPEATVALASPAPRGGALKHLSLWSGVGLLAFGGAAMGVASQAGKDYNSGDMSAYDRSRGWAGAGWAALGVGAALVGGGVYLWTRGGAERPTTAVVLAPGPGGAALQLRGQW